MSLPQPPIDRYRIRVRLNRPARFRFLHGGALRGLVSRAAEQHDLPPGLIPFAPESGRIAFAAGDAYQFGITLVGDERRLAGRLLAGLVKVGQRHPTTTSRPTLGGNFELETVEPLPTFDSDREAESLLAAPATTLQFLSPLRLKRPRNLQRPGATYLNADCFPAGHLLASLWARLFLLASGRRPDHDERRRLMPPIPSSVRATPGEMPWLDLPMAGGSNKDNPYTLGGVLGSTRLRGLTEEWLQLLALGRHLHLGAGTTYGLGRYRLLEEARPEPFQPAALLWTQPDGTPLSAGNDSARFDSFRIAATALLEDSSHAYRLGLTSAGADRAERAALDEGVRWRRRVDVAELLEHVDRRCTAQRVRAVFPLDPPPRPTPFSSRPVRESHALLVLPEIAAAVAPDRLMRMPDGLFLLGRRPLTTTSAAATTRTRDAAELPPAAGRALISSRLA